jgi:prolyl oligopeptidase
LKPLYYRRSNSDSKTLLLSILWVPVLLIASYSLFSIPDKPSAIPDTPRKPAVETYYGEKVQEDYQWLEDWHDPAVRAWSDAQNAHARAVLDALPGRKQIRDRLAAFDSDTSVAYFNAQHRQGLLFFLKSQPPKQQPFLVALDSSLSPNSERVIVDPGVIDRKGLTAIDFFVSSRDSRYVAVSMS